MNRRHSPVSWSVAVVGAGALVATLLGCASTSSPHATRSSTSTTASTGSTGSSPTTSTGKPKLQVPDTLADGSFPSVLDPSRDGSLKSVSVKLTTVARSAAPTALVPRPGHPHQLFLAQRAGQVRLVTIDPATRSLKIHPGNLVNLSSLTSTDGELGLLGLAFDRSGKVLYLSWTRRNGDTRIDAAPVTDSGGIPHVGQRTNLLSVDQMGTNIHKGGDLVVDENGYLSIGLGDGGPENDPEDHAQNPDLLLGKILRIDPEHPSGSKPYGIPADNPDPTGAHGAPEIYLTGLRNPWRFSIDPASGDLWIGDVGQNRIEEIDRLPPGAVSAGANLGWSGYEGTTVFDRSRIRPGTVPPIFETSHRDGNCAITGGVVYRGKKLRGLDGAYLFADLCHPGIDALRATTPPDGIGAVTDERQLAGTAQASEVISFATDATGEVYALSLDGTISRLDPAR